MCKFTRLAFFDFDRSSRNSKVLTLCCAAIFNYLSNWFHCPNALQLYHIFLICVNILWKITSWSRVSFHFLPCILIYALLDRFLSDHTIGYPVADSHPLKHAFFPSVSILLEKIHTSFSLVGFTRHVHVLVCFSVTVYLFMPLLTKMRDPPLLFTPSIGQVGRPIPGQSHNGLTSVFIAIGYRTSIL